MNLKLNADLDERLEDKEGENIKEKSILLQEDIQKFIYKKLQDIRTRKVIKIVFCLEDIKMLLWSY